MGVDTENPMTFHGVIQSPSIPVGRDAFRPIEVLLCVAALIFLAPLMALIAAIIWVGYPGPILFKQQRIGQAGRRFNCLKFRSMAVDAEERLQALLETDPAARLEWERVRKLSHDPRITGFGMFLRRTSLDELPQLFNVLRSEMSLVGPRPIVVAELPYYGRYIEHYCSVKPGISGLWQISGRSDTTYRRRVACDVLYARRKTLKLDLMIVLITIPAVLASKGAR